MKSQLDAQQIQLDQAQSRVLEKLDCLRERLVSDTFWGRLKRSMGLHAQQGLYLWGGVGRGKTMLMDFFYDSLEDIPKQRIHFHRFMVMVHDALNERQGMAYPLKSVAKDFSRKVRVLCFDEFFVSDIADAMILGQLFEYLFKNGVVLVATSNVQPSQLYRNGLGRSKFLPAIALIERHTQVVHMGDGEDFRLRTLMQAELYYVGQNAFENLNKTFKQLCPDIPFKQQEIIIAHRSIPVKGLADGVVWFSFQALCEEPRASIDFIEIAKMFNTVLISDVPKMDESKEDAAKRFIVVVDEFYERQVKLIMSASLAIEKLYQGRSLQFEFERTKSRLIEMQSHAYLEKPHKP